MTTNVVEIAELTVSFGGLTAVDRVSFSVGQDEMVALIGPNGAGKTVVLNTVCGIYRPDGGQVLVRGQEVSRKPAHAVAGLGVGRAFQHGELFAGLTVVENLLVPMTHRLPRSSWSAGLRWAGYLRKEIEARERVEEILEFFELERYRHTEVSSLPFGIQKLVGVARAVSRSPSVLLLDEPSSGLARQEKEDFARFLLRLRYDLKLPVLWTEHDMQMVQDLADRVVVLDHGAKIAEGQPREIAENPAVIEAYLGTSSSPATSGPA